jgi:hypothetical protein
MSLASNTPMYNLLEMVCRPSSLHRLGGLHVAAKEPVHDGGLSGASLPGHLYSQSRRRK